ncbi:MAG TPA: hypothetical protein VKV19_19210 [Ktedonobacteraceae bacterium]|nr:hypothetical protein [Ktedonobacteraceae bacterium]
MSKSKSRHPSNATSGPSKSGANGSARQVSATGKTPVKSSVENGATAPEKASATTATARQTPAANASTKPASSASANARPASASSASTKPIISATSKAKSKDAIKYERRQAERQQRYLAQRRARRNKILFWSAAALVVVLGSLGGYLIYRAHQPATANAASPGSVYQEAIYNSNYPPVDNVYCDALEGSVTHIHAHVSIYINGKLEDIPQYVGIPQDSSGNVICYYWLHTHDTSGVIHIESPASANETFTFGQFVAEWDEYFNNLGFYPQLLLNSGWTIWTDGKKYNGTLDSIPLTAHNLITIAYNSPNVKPDTTYAWNGL